ncbi:MAG TPA: glycerol-3-phosphate dehydrogenase/oxidase [Gemmatimonadaceae bacterium]|nr:glycerol-3-phosphate dehydrogenase/oxidase [Gemmatimonadaceae bacterium]
MSAPLPTSVHVSALAHRARLSRESFDVIVIGGGINGCGVARDAAMRGLSVALIEKDDFGGGTSGRTSRLVHGGLRYLEHGRIGLVRESRRERATLMRIAPHLVRPLQFSWPVYRGARVSRRKLGAGLTLYDLLSLSGPGSWHERLGPAEVAAREPALRREGLSGGGAYFDSSADDARLTLANALSAAYWDAAVASHMCAELLPGGPPHRVALSDRITGESFTICGRTVVNALGPWSCSGPHSKGSHIAVDRALVGNRDAIALLSPIDGRVMFILPSGAQTIIGTTEIPTSVSPDEVRASESEIDYLLTSANSYLADARLSRADVISAWAGLRPLALATSDPSSASREHLMSRDSHGAITISGGKLTTYRAVAEEAVDLVQVTLGMRVTRCRTALEALPGADRGTVVAEMIRNEPSLGASLTDATDVRPADLLYSVRHEHALTLSDLLIRRTLSAFSARDHAMSLAAPAAEVVAPLLGWTAEMQASAVANYARDVERTFTIDPD